MQNLANECKWMYGQVAIAAGSSIDSDGTELDMQNYDGAIFVVAIEDSANTGVATMTIEGSDTSGSGYAAITGAVATATSAADDDLNTKLLVVDIYRPANRYLHCTLTSATANIAYGTQLQFAYRGRNAPITQITAEIAQLTSLVGP